MFNLPQTLKHPLRIASSHVHAGMKPIDGGRQAGEPALSAMRGLRGKQGEPIVVCSASDTFCFASVASVAY